MPLSTKLPAKRRIIDGKEKTAYEKLIKNIVREYAKSKGVDINENNLQKDVKDMIDFEIKLSKVIDVFFFIVFFQYLFALKIFFIFRLI